MEDPQNDPQVCSEGSDEGDTWGNRGRNPQLPIPIRDALFGASCMFLGRSGITALWSPPTGVPVPPGLSQLFEVLQDLEGCHRLLSPSPPTSPALLELQT